MIEYDQRVLPLSKLLDTLESVDRELPSVSHPTHKHMTEHEPDKIYFKANTLNSACQGVSLTKMLPPRHTGSFLAATCHPSAVLQMPRPRQRLLDLTGIDECVARQRTRYCRPGLFTCLWPSMRSGRMRPSRSTCAPRAEKPRTCHQTLTLWPRTMVGSSGCTDSDSHAPGSAAVSKEIYNVPQGWQ